MRIPEETRVVGILCDESCMILTSTVPFLTDPPRVTDGRTDGRAIARSKVPECYWIKNPDPDPFGHEQLLYSISMELNWTECTAVVTSVWTVVDQECTVMQLRNYDKLINRQETIT